MTSGQGKFEPARRLKRHRGTVNADLQAPPVAFNVGQLASKGRGFQNEGIPEGVAACVKLWMSPCQSGKAMHPPHIGCRRSPE